MIKATSKMFREAFKTVGTLMRYVGHKSVVMTYDPLAEDESWEPKGRAERIRHLTDVNEALKSALAGDTDQAIQGALADGESYGRTCERNRCVRLLSEAWKRSRPDTEVRYYLAEQLGPDQVAELCRERGRGVRWSEDRPKWDPWPDHASAVQHAERTTRWRDCNITVIKDYIGFNVHVQSPENEQIAFLHGSSLRAA